jgi:hypothetical protein
LRLNEAFVVVSLSLRRHFSLSVMVTSLLTMRSFKIQGTGLPSNVDFGSLVA